ncbi:methyltransferase [Aquimarina sp. M1]
MLKRIKKAIFPLAKFAFDTYHLRHRTYEYKGIKVAIHPEVFPPHFTISTKVLLDYLNPLDLEKKSFLELGCGSGIISLFAASKGANVIASDINPIAIKSLEEASIDNNLEINILQSDLFDKMIPQPLDYIVINPPYYPRTPKNDKERAWYCGENFEYFKKLFSQLPKHIAPNTWMILSEDCDIRYIKELAINNRLEFDLIFKKSIVREKNFIFNIQKL